MKRPPPDPSWKRETLGSSSHENWDEVIFTGVRRQRRTQVPNGTAGSLPNTQTYCPSPSTSPRASSPPSSCPISLALPMPSDTFPKAPADTVLLPASLPTVDSSKKTSLTSAPLAPQDPFSSLPLPTKLKARLPCLAQHPAPPSFPQAAPFSANFCLPVCL